MYYRFCAFLTQAVGEEVCTLMVEADEMGMERWPKYDEVRALRQRVGGIYWALVPAANKANMSLERYRRMQERRRADAVQRRRKKRLVKRALIFALPAMETAVLGLTFLKDMLVSESYGAWRNPRGDE